MRLQEKLRCMLQEVFFICKKEKCKLTVDRQERNSSYNVGVNQKHPITGGMIP